MFVKIANSADPDQTASSKQSDLGLHCLSCHFDRQRLLQNLEHLLFCTYNDTELLPLFECHMPMCSSLNKVMLPTPKGNRSNKTVSLYESEYF